MATNNGGSSSAGGRPTVAPVQANAIPSYQQQQQTPSQKPKQRGNNNGNTPSPGLGFASGGGGGIGASLAAQANSNFRSPPLTNASAYTSYAATPQGSMALADATASNQASPVKEHQHHQHHHHRQGSGSGTGTGPLHVLLPPNHGSGFPDGPPSYDSSVRSFPSSGHGGLNSAHHHHQQTPSLLLLDEDEAESFLTEERRCCSCCSWCRSCACARCLSHTWFMCVCCGFVLLSSLPRFLTIVDFIVTVLLYSLSFAGRTTPSLSFWDFLEDDWTHYNFQFRFFTTHFHLRTAQQQLSSARCYS